jgi:hypothetical protein
VVLATKRLAAVFIVAFLSSTASGLPNVATANPNVSNLVMAMPEEYVHYTITRVNGTLWAKIDGTYPIQILADTGNESLCIPFELPMVYPTPPGTTNIYLSANNAELGWNNYPYDTHHTAIGDWTMIYCSITPVQEQFLLKIHYEHPLEKVNGSYLFLYDLNISPYLSLQSPNSTAFFTIRVDTDVSNLEAYTTESDTVWKPINYTISQEGTAQLIMLQMRSEYSKPLLGDLVIMFSDDEAETTEVTLWIVISLILIAALLVFIIYRKQRGHVSGLNFNLLSRSISCCFVFSSLFKLSMLYLSALSICSISLKRK